MIVGNDSTLLILEKNKFRICDLDSNLCTVIQIEKKSDEDLGYVLAGCVSDCNKYICVSDDFKRIYLYEKSENQWNLVRKRSLDKRCSKITITNDLQNIFVADKSGYLLRIPFDFVDLELDDEKGEYNFQMAILGHVSVLTDFDLHPKQKLIATSDRDEKIRLSYYTNGQVYSYLLGHSKFITHILFTRDCKKLISVGGDGQVIIWDLLTSREVNRHCYSDKEVAPVVTRAFLLESVLFLFFQNESLCRILHISPDGTVSSHHQFELECKVQDAHVRNFGQEIQIIVISNPHSWKFETSVFNKTNNTLKKQESWLELIAIEADQFVRQKFLESLPKTQLDKTGVDTYFEKKEKRQRKNGERNQSDNDDE